MRRTKTFRIVLKALVLTAVILSLLQLLAPLILAPPGSEEKSFQPTIVKAQAVAPTTAQTSSVANIRINYTAVASINAVAGYYYAVNTTLTGNLSAFYVNWTDGKIYYVPTYIWDLNSKYVIFQAPANITIYLIYNTSQSIPVLSTRSWFNPPDPQPISLSVTFPSPFSTTKSATIYPSTNPTPAVSVYYNGSVVVNATYTASYSTSLTASVSVGTNTIAGGATYTASISVSSNPSGVSLSASPSGYVSFPGTTYSNINNAWGTTVWAPSLGSWYVDTYSLSYTSASGFTSSASVSITTSSTITTYGPYGTSTVYDNYVVSISGTLTSNKVILYSKDSSGVITAPNGNKIAPIDSVPLTVSSSSSSLTVYLSSSSNLTYSLSLSLPSYTGRNVSISLPPGYAFVNITNSSGSLVSSSLYTISYSSSSAYMFFNETLPAYYGSSLTIYLTAKNIITNISLSNPKPLYDPSDWTNMTINITLQDPLGSPLTDYQVNMNITTASGSLVYTGSNTSSSGYAIFNLNLSLTSGTYKITLFTTGAYAGFYMPTPFLSTGYMSISPGDMLMPHLYTWYFDGSSGYLYIYRTWQFNPSSLTISMWVYQLSYYTTSPEYFDRNGYYALGFYNGYIWSGLNISNTWVVRYGNTQTPLNTWVHVVMSFDSSAKVRKHYLNGVLDASWSESASLTVYNSYRIIIGANGNDNDTATNPPSDFKNTYIENVVMHNRALSDQEVSNLYNNIINSLGLILFTDPTFFDGSYYRDASLGITVYPSGGVYRIPDNRTWIYLVKGSGSGSVNLRFFPNTTALLIYDSSGNVVGRIDFSQLTSQFPAYSSGIIPGPIPINLPAGSYRLELYNTSYIQIAGMKSYGFDVTTATIKTVLVNSRSPTKYIRIDNISISPNDTLAPHIYTWYFDGVDDYINVSSSSSLKLSSSFTLAGWFLFPPGIIGSRGVVQKNPQITDYDYMLYLSSGGYSSVYFKNLSGTVFAIGYPVDHRDNSWHFWTGIFDGRYLKMYTDANLRASTDTGGQTVRTSDTSLAIGYGWGGNVRMFSAYVLIYSRALSDSEIYNAYVYNIINSSGLVLFLDPTFYNTTHFLDLSGNNNHGVGYNGVARIPDSRTWIYLVKNLSSDNLVHLRFFPVGTVYVFRSLAGYIISYGIVNGSVNSAGLVEDFTINIPQGSYTVEFYIPDPGSTTYQLGSSYILSSSSPGISLSSSEPVRVAVGSYAYICFLPFYTYNNTLIRSFNMNISVGSSTYSISSSSPCINISSSTVSVVKISPTSFLDPSYNITTIDSSYTTSASIVFDKIQIKFNVQPSYVVAINSSVTLFGTAKYVSDGYSVSDGVVDISDGYNIYRARIINGQFSFSYRPNSTGTVSFYAVRAVDFPNPVSISLSSYSENSVIPIAHAQALGSGYGFVTAYTTDMVQITFYVVQPVAAQIIGVSTFLANLGSSVVYLLLGFSMSIGIFVIMAKIYDWPVAGVFASFVLLIMFLLAGLTGPATVVLIFLILFLAFAIYRS